MRRIVEVFILLLSGILIIALFDPYPREKEDYSLSDISVPNLEIAMEYGIVLDSMEVIRDVVKRNEFLADILLKYDVDYAKINAISKIPDSVFNVRKIKRGNHYSILCTRDSLKKVKYFIYEENPMSFVVFELGDSVRVHRGNKEIELLEIEAFGIIESSLWNAMIDNDTDPNLANELSEVFAWIIDFFDIKKGDYYKVIYEKMMVDGEYIGLGKIRAAMFHHNGEDYYAFYFVQDSLGDYFDLNGGSMRRTFLKAPLRFRRISSGFSYRRFHPILKIYRPHTGVDYAADYGTPVHSVGDGVVVKKGWTKQGGRRIQIKHNGYYSTAYLHLSAYAKGLHIGSKIKQGDVIGYVGQSGLATGPHLDFRFYKNGKPINPLKVKSPPAEPIDSTYLDLFNKAKAEWMAKLENMGDNVVAVNKK